MPWAAKNARAEDFTTAKPRFQSPAPPGATRVWLAGNVDESSTPTHFRAGELQAATIDRMPPAVSLASMARS
jgi:NADPH-dependent ferric siderophore reductase